MIREAIAKLVEHQDLSHHEAYLALSDIMNGEATDAQIAAFITALRMKGETPDVVSGCAQAMREKFTAVDAHCADVVDTCGTGGDCSHTFNISTASALVSAGAGIRVAKHGNKSVSSKCGSADVLSALGVNIAVEADHMSRCMQEVGIAFLFAPALHPAMKYAIGPRKELGVRTVFNMLGPLCNPAGTRRGVLGVYSAGIVELMAQAAMNLGAERLFVVHGNDGLDEITTTTSTIVSEVRDKTLSTREIHPDDYGIPTARPEDLKGGEPQENADIMRAILKGEKGPRRDIVCLNAAAAIVAGGKAEDIPAGYEQAQKSIDSGEAMKKLESLIALTNQI